jgi:hypothetical protein
MSFDENRIPVNFPKSQSLNETQFADSMIDLISADPRGVRP